jgi:uncharacterized protein YecE (DUF72 family)
MSARLGRAWIGTSGYDYPHWRGTFYPPTLPHRLWLPHAARAFDSIELNGTFYSLKTAKSFRRLQEAARPGFVYAVKGSRFITHRLKLRSCGQALANFYASGLLELGRRTGPFLWQLPPQLPFDGQRMESFLEMLPANAAAAEALAGGHDHRVKDPALTSPARVRYRHAFEVRHPSFFQPAFYDLLRRHRAAFVIADTAGRFGYAEEVTADFVYVRLHGSQVLYGSQYQPAEIEAWARRVEGWLAGPPPRDVYVYFDNDHRAYAAHDALALAARLAAPQRAAAM